MADWSNKAQTTTSKDDTKPRWRQILDLPDSTRIWDLSTGLHYTVGQFVPLYQNQNQSAVCDFLVKGTGEKVHVAFLRLAQDRSRCSLRGGHA